MRVAVDAGDTQLTCLSAEPVCKEIAQQSLLLGQRMLETCLPSLPCHKQSPVGQIPPQIEASDGAHTQPPQLGQRSKGGCMLQAAACCISPRTQYCADMQNTPCAVTLPEHDSSLQVPSSPSLPFGPALPRSVLGQRRIGDFLHPDAINETLETFFDGMTDAEREHSMIWQMWGGQFCSCFYFQ